MELLPPPSLPIRHRHHAPVARASAMGRNVDVAVRRIVRGSARIDACSRRAHPPAHQPPSDARRRGAGTPLLRHAGVSLQPALVLVDEHVHDRDAVHLRVGAVALLFLSRPERRERGVVRRRLRGGGDLLVDPAGHREHPSADHRARGMSRSSDSQVESDDRDRDRGSRRLCGHGAGAAGPDRGVTD